MPLASVKRSGTLVPGPISETLLLGEALGRHGAAHSFLPDAVSPDALEGAFRAVLDRPGETAAMLERARTLVTGGGGVDAAARLVLDIGAKRRAATA